MSFAAVASTKNLFYLFLLLLEFLNSYAYDTLAVHIQAHISDISEYFRTVSDVLYNYSLGQGVDGRKGVD